MSEIMENNEMVNVEEQTYDAPEEKSNGTLLLIGIGAGCAALGYGIKAGVDAIKRHVKAKKEKTEEDKPKEKKGFKLFGKKTKSEEKKEETKETEKKADEAEAKKEES